MNESEWKYPDRVSCVHLDNDTLLCQLQQGFPSGPAVTLTCSIPTETLNV